jgi:hypothetical protein
MEAERWERLAVAEPDPQPEPVRADLGGAGPFRSLLGYAIRGGLEGLSTQIYLRASRQARFGDRRALPPAPG